MYSCGMQTHAISASNALFWYGIHFIAKEAHWMQIRQDQTFHMDWVLPSWISLNRSKQQV